MVKELIKKFIPSFLLKFYHYSLALFGAFFYGFPSQKLKVIGVTGTSGKSTVVDLISRIFEEAGYKTASLSSVRFKINNKEWENKLKMTMPGRFQIQKFLKKAVKEKCKYAVLEITSEGIKQYRHKFIDFDTAVFTNLSPEHVESHGGFENYREAKLKLFKQTKNIHIVNLDDENAKYFLQIPVQKLWGYSIKIPNFQTIFAKDIQKTPEGIIFSINDVKFNLNLLGEFNVYNSLAAICVGLSQGIPLDICKKALEKTTGIPGRMEVVIKEPFVVIVDYAHTPTALEEVYKTLKPSPLICVLGSCGGGRDKWKRPVLGKIAAQYCKKIIITNEDPYDDEPMGIIDEIAEGAGDKAKKILDRREAIKEALKIAKTRDIVVITGKGCEPWLCVKKNKKIPWDDRKVVREEFRKLESNR